MSASSYACSRASRSSSVSTVEPAASWSRAAVTIPSAAAAAPRGRARASAPRPPPPGAGGWGGAPRAAERRENEHHRPPQGESQAARLFGGHGGGWSGHWRPSLGRRRGGPLPYDRVMGGNDLVARVPDLIARMPKAELHLHLDGSLRPSTALALARQRGLDEGVDLPRMERRV